jgi:hypothetical protein
VKEAQGWDVNPGQIEQGFRKIFYPHRQIVLHIELMAKPNSFVYPNKVNKIWKPYGIIK